MKDLEVAFPGGMSTTGGLPVQTGMSLRDYFAAKAMVGLLSSGDINLHEKGYEVELISWSYRLADTMLAEREKKS